MQFTFVALAFACLPFIAASPRPASSLVARGCDSETVSTTYVGVDKNVQVEYHGCPNDADPTNVNSLVQPDAGNYPNLCGAACTTYCTTPAGNGPVVGDCQVITDALVYESQNGDADFYINVTSATSTNYVVMTYDTCSTTFVNQYATPISYCNIDWAGVLGYVAPTCTASANAQGGICLAEDQGWFIDVKHS